MPNHLSKYVLVILSLCFSVQAWANPTDVAVDTQFTSPLAQTASRDLSQVSTDALSVIASFLPTDQIPGLARSKKSFNTLLRKVLLSPENENRFKAEFISTFKKLQKRNFQDTTDQQILSDFNKLKDFSPKFFTYSQLYVFTKLYHYLAFRRSSWNQSNPSLNEFRTLSRTCYPQHFNKDEYNEFEWFLHGCSLGIALAVGVPGCPTNLALALPILGGVTSGVLLSKSPKSFLLNSCYYAAAAVAMPFVMIPYAAVEIYDRFCPLDRETFPGSDLDNGKAKRNKNRTKLAQMYQNIRKVPVIHSILKPFVFGRYLTKDEHTRISQDIEFLCSIPQMREVLAFAGAINWALQPIANEVRTDILSDDDQPADSDDSSDLHSPALESQGLLRQRR